ncbi:hypothetical protein [Streptomyces tsukubensis]|uniref:hypothetical protein n=1 Tax=Streptomyces tsukubensis TaxID=83656 RepID=UPI00344F106F
MAISRARAIMLTGLASAFAVTITALGAAHAAPGNEATSGEMPHAVEDFAYPGAANIQTEKGITLKRGDGRIVLTACDRTEDIAVITLVGEKEYCFDVLAKPAYLTLEVAGAYGTWAGEHPIKHTLVTADGTKSVVTAVANDFTGYGSAAGTNPAKSTLIELRVD